MSASMKHAEQTPLSPLDHRYSRFIPPLILIVAVLAVYANSLWGVFLLDDSRYIENNRRIQDFGSSWKILTGRRPVADFTIAVNHAIGGLNPRGYHIVNIAIHAIAALTLFGVTSRSLLRKRFGKQMQRSAPMIALAVALIWAVHPLNTQSVTYVVQRCESLMGMFFLLTIYCFLRGVDSPRPVWWYAGATLACAMGMESKAVMVVAPILVLIYDRTFVADSFRDLFRRRILLYVALAGTWSLLFSNGILKGVLIPSAKRAKATVGFSFREIAPIEYLQTQAGVILHYLRLSVWPDPLCLDYGWTVARTFSSIVLPGLAILALLAGTIWALAKKPWLGFLGAWFFIILAPTSSFIPIRDPAFEHRMYLPLIAPVALAVVGIWRLLSVISRRCNWSGSRFRVVAISCVVVAVMALGWKTVDRNRDYHSAETMWRDVITQRPENHRGHFNLATTLLDQGDAAQAEEHFRRALNLKPNFTLACYNLGKSLQQIGKPHQAAEYYAKAIDIEPACAEAHSDLGNYLLRTGNVDQAITHYREAIRSKPLYARAHFNLGQALLGQGEQSDAVEALETAAQLAPETARIHRALGKAYQAQGRLDDAARSYRRALILDPADTATKMLLDRIGIPKLDSSAP